MPLKSQFRRSVAADTKRKGGSRKGAFFEKFRVPQDFATSIILMKGEYVDPNPPPELIEVDAATGRPRPVVNPYFKTKMHTRKMLKNGHEFFATEVCSAGHESTNPQPCVGCYAQDTGDKSVSIKDSFAIGMVHLAYYHGHPLIDSERGGIVMKKDNSGPVIIYTECESRNGRPTCNFCRALQGQPPLPPKEGEDPWPGYDPRSITTIFGRKRYLEIGKNHLADLMGFDQVISSQCANCKQQLITDGFKCPICQTMAIDMQNDQRTDEQIAEAVAQPYPCMRCQRPVQLEEIVSCDFCENQGRQGVQNSVFDVVLNVQRQGESTNSHLVRHNHMTLEEYGSGINQQFLGGKTLRDHVAELMKEPYNFDEIYRPRNLQDQAKRLDLPLPPGLGGGGGQPPYMAYGAAPQQTFMQPGPAYGQPAAPPPGYAPAPGYPPQGYAPPPGAPAAPFSTQPPGYPPQPAPAAAPAAAPFPGFVPPGRPNYGA